MRNFVAVGSWVSILWGVKIRHLPLTWPVAVNTVLALPRSLWYYYGATITTVAGAFAKFIMPSNHTCCIICLNLNAISSVGTQNFEGASRAYFWVNGILSCYLPCPSRVPTLTSFVSVVLEIKLISVRKFWLIVFMFPLQCVGLEELWNSGAAPRFWKWGDNFARGASKNFFWPPTFWPMGGGQNIA